MNTLKFNLLSGDSITHNVIDHITLYDIILEIPDSNEYIYKVFIQGQEECVYIKTLLTTLYNEQKPVFLLKANISESLKILHQHSTFPLNIHNLYYNTSLLIKYYCVSLEPLKELTHLTELDIRYSHNTNTTYIKPIQSLTNLVSLTLSRCINVATLYDIQFLKQIKTLNILDAPMLIDIYNIQSLNKLTHLTLNRCSVLTNASYIKYLSQLEELYIYNCSNIYDISFLSYLFKLNTLCLYKCKSIYDISPLNELYNIKDLTLFTDKTCFIDNIEIIQDLINLTSLKLKCNTNTNNILLQTQLIREFKNLKTLELYDCSVFAGIELPIQLTTLHLYKCNIFTLDTIKHMTMLESLYIIIDTCQLYTNDISHVLYNLDYINCFTSLEHLRLEGLFNIDVSKIAELHTLKRLYLRNNINLKNLDLVRRISTMESVDIVDCYTLEEDNTQLSFIRNTPDYNYT